MSDVDTMRWGDTQTLLLSSTSAAGEGGVSMSKQMLWAKWQRPCVWRLMVSISTNLSGSASALTFAVQIVLFVGVGQANQQVPLLIVPFATPFNPVVEFFDIPAEAMQVQFAIGNLSNSVTDQSAVTVAAFAAPHAEPGAVVQLRDHMGAMRGGIAQPDQEGLGPWMGPGFEDGELQYRHGRR